VENALEHAAEVERKTYRESLQNNRDQIVLSKKLATIHTDVPVPLDLEALAAREPDVTALRQLYRTLEFTSLLRDLGPARPSGPRDYEALDAAGLEEWLARLDADRPVAIAAGEMMGQAVIACCAEPGIARYAPVDDGRIPARASVCHGMKSLLRRFGEAPNLQHDVMLYGFLLSSDPGACDLPALAERYLEESVEGGPAAEADAALRLFCKLRPEVESGQLADVYRTIDLPLVRVLADMEGTGILIDPQQLSLLSRRMEEEIARISAEIYELAGKTFNINSPQQLGKVLFEDLHLPAPVKYGKGKTISTAAGVLEELAEEYPIARRVLDFRQLAKLKGTYSDALPALIDPFTGRLHTTFNQAGAATGRLASSDPNLQNIPIRTALGREIRAAFIPRPGWKLIIADYSQIELRLLAHFSRDPVLVEAFVHGEDIHTRTAAEVFGVPPLMVTADHRRRAKAVNFGIVYGQSPFGLAQSLGIERKEAETYIRAYFERYAGVRKWLDATIAEVRRTGYAYNLFGRRRPIPDMNSRNFTARGFAERTAVNTPLQGTAADLIKLAMIRLHEKLRSMQAKLLLQVHDELVLEAPPEEVGQLRSMVKAAMENVHKLEVPLLVDVEVGDNWRDAE
jgi:DNA polymerase-1